MTLHVHWVAIQHWDRELPFSLVFLFIFSIPLSPFCFHRLEGWSAYLSLMFAFFNCGKVGDIV